MEVKIELPSTSSPNISNPCSSVYGFFLNSIKIGVCLVKNGTFLFECSNGLIAKMQIINSVY
jgi:hypothetical protein